ncbi:MAG TPA: hypothetical protein PLP42_11555 [Acidobacteriota bacterium]|nr:hypothetical protein [Acidobacteriota bacterium]
MATSDKPTRLTPLREHLLALGVYLFLSLVMTYPLVLHLRTALLGDGDAWLFVWNFWWWSFALSNGLNPFCTDFIHYPTGICAYLHTWNFVNTWATVPLQWIISLNTLYNLCALATFVLAAWGMFRLARFLGLATPGAFLAGLAYSFNAFHYAEANGHLNIMTYQAVPFFLQAMLQGLEGWTRRRILVATLWLIVVALSDWYYLLFCVLATAILVLARLTLRRQGFWRMAGGVILVGILAFLVLSPLIISMILQSGLVPHHRVGATFSPDLLSFFLPPATTSYSHMLGGLTQPWLKWGSAVSTPWSLLLLVPFGIRALVGWNRRWTVIWIGAFFILSLGPFLHVAGRTFDQVLLPYGWLEKIPGFFLARTPIRLHIMTWVGLAILYGAAAARLTGSRRQWLKASLLGVLFLLETLSVPFGLSHPDISPFYRRIQASPGQLALIDLHYNSRALFYQTLHKQKLMGLPGIVSRQTLPALRFMHETHGIRELLQENHLLFFTNGLPSTAIREASSLPPGNRHLLLAGYSELSGEIRVRSSLPHRLQVEGRFIEGHHETATTISKHDLFVVRIDLTTEDMRAPAVPVRIWIGGQEIAEGSPVPARPILPTVRIPFERTGITCLVYPNVVAASPDSSALSKIKAEGFDWIIVPFYANDQYIRTVLGLTPHYRDRWLSAYELEE